MVGTLARESWAMKNTLRTGLIAGSVLATLCAASAASATVWTFSGSTSDGPVSASALLTWSSATDILGVTLTNLEDGSTTKSAGQLVSGVEITLSSPTPAPEPTSVELVGGGDGEGDGDGLGLGCGECPPFAAPFAAPPNIVETGPSSVIRMSGLPPDECAVGLSSSKFELKTESWGKVEEAQPEFVGAP